MAVRLSRLVFAVLLCVGFGGRLHGAGLTFSDQAKRIKVGVVLTASASANPSYRPNPYTFYVMDRREDVKPAGWELYNPFAPSHVTADIAARWGGACPVGAPVTKDMGCYWEVPITDITPEDLAQYDVLLLTGYADPALTTGVITFSNREREKLRKFVDNGGVLWVDYRRDQISGAWWRSVVNGSSFFVTGLGFDSPGAGPSVPAMVPPVAQSHSLVNRPFYLTPKDINLLGGHDPGWIGNEFVLLPANSEAAYAFMPIVMRGSFVSLAAAQYGSGYVVASADGVGQAISDPVGANGGRCGVAFFAAQSEDLKLAFNIISLGSEHTTPQRCARRTGYSFGEIGAPLISMWKYMPGAHMTQAPYPTDGSAAILDDMIFYVGDGMVDGSGNVKNARYVLHALDLSPVRDRDGDGDPDDGVKDGLGAPYDVLWEYEIGCPCSPPTVAYAPYTGVGIVPCVFVVAQPESSAAKVLQFNAVSGIGTGVVANPVEFFTNASFQLKPFPSNPSDWPRGFPEIPAPVYSAGSLYIADGNGYIHAHDLFSPTGSEWMHPQQGVTTDYGIANSPVLGSFYDPTSGATEQIVYLSTRGKPNVVSGSVRAYPIRSCNEALTRDNSQVGLYKIRSTNTQIETIDPSRLPQLWYTFDLNAQPTPIAPANFTVPGPGRFQIIPDTYYTANNLADATILADYWMDHDGDSRNPDDFKAVPPAFRQIPIEQPGVGTDYAGVTGPPAAGKNDILYFATENGCIYAVKEMGRGGVSGSGASATLYPPLCVKWRYYLGDAPAKQMLGLAGMTSPKTEIEFIGSPVVVGDMVYVAMNYKTVPKQGYILAFKADPTFSMKLANPIKAGTQVTVRQTDTLKDSSTYVDFVASYSASAANVASTIPFTVDYEAGKLTFVNFRPRSVTGELSSSQESLVIYTPDTGQAAGTAVQPIQEPHKVVQLGDSWNNLVWYVKLLDPVAPLEVTSSPMVLGSILYVGCANGKLCSMDLDKMRQATPPAGQFQLPFSSNYIWADQIYSDTGVALTTPINAAVAGSHGMLAVTSPEGISMLYNPVSLVADSNRLLEVDVGGRVVWQCDSTSGFTSTTVFGGSSSRVAYGSVDMAFNKPSVARRTPQGGIVVADTGNNRIVYIDKGGGQMWQITDFVEPMPGMYPQSDPTATPPVVRPSLPLLPAGSPMHLDKPTDVTAWMTIEPDSYDEAGSPIRPVFHFLIADSGNYRVVEIASRFDPRVGEYRNVLLKVSKSLEEGKQYRYMTARPVAYRTPRPNDPGGPSMIACAVSNQDNKQADLGGAGGAIVKLDWTLDATGGTASAPINRIPLPPSPTDGIQLANPTFYTMQFMSNVIGDVAEIAIDARGIHIARTTVDPSTGNRIVTIGSYLVSDHLDIINGAPYPRPFAPAYAQFLPNEHVLVTNKATGTEYFWNAPLMKIEKRSFSGEVFELEIDSSIPPVKKGTYVEVKYRRAGSSIPRTPGILHQPSSAERLLY